MSAKDLTHSRLVEIKRHVKYLLEDLEDMTRTAQSISFQCDNFSSSEKYEDSLKRQLSSPSLFYSYRYFDKYIEVRRCGRSDVYGVLIHGYELDKSFYDELNEGFQCNISIKFNETFISGVDFDTVKQLFIFCVSYVFKNFVYVQKSFDDLGIF